jgi:lysozyme
MTKKNKRKLLAALFIIVAAVSTVLIYKYRKIKINKPVINNVNELKVPPSYENALLGIDVSKWQGEINWEKVAQNNKIKFAYCRSTCIKLVCLDTDDSYTRNIENLKKYPQIKKGSYHFLSPYISGKKQADYFIEHSIFAKGDLMPVLDIEKAHKLSEARLIKVINDFILEFKEKTGLDLIIYSNLSFYNDHLKNKFPNNKLWLANYRNNDSKIKKTNWAVWQYTEKGKMQGINAYVDINIFNGDSLDLNDILIH